MSLLHQRVNEYLALRRAMGFKLREHGLLLPRFRGFCRTERSDNGQRRPDAELGDAAHGRRPVPVEKPAVGRARLRPLSTCSRLRHGGAAAKAARLSHLTTHAVSVLRRGGSQTARRHRAAPTAVSGGELPHRVRVAGGHGVAGGRGDCARAPRCRPRTQDVDGTPDQVQSVPAAPAPALGRRRSGNLCARARPVRPRDPRRRTSSSQREGRRFSTRAYAASSPC